MSQMKGQIWPGGAGTPGAPGSPGSPGAPGADGADGADGLPRQVQDEGSNLPIRDKLNFVGAGVTATDDSANNRTLITIPGGGSGTGGHTIQEEGSDLPSRTNLNFIGSAVTAADNAIDDSTDVTITVPSETLPESLIGAKGDLIAGAADNIANRLPVGADGYILYADSGEALGLRWGSLTSGLYVPLSIINAKGDLIVGTADDTAARLPRGTDGQMLIVDTAQTTGLRWEDRSTTGHQILDEGTARTQRSKLNFIGSNVAVTDDSTNDETEVTISESLAASIIDAKGDLIVGTAADTPARLAVGTDGTIPIADSTQTAGIRWAAGGGLSTTFRTTHTFLVGDFVLDSTIVPDMHVAKTASQSISVVQMVARLESGTSIDVTLRRNASAVSTARTITTTKQSFTYSQALSDGDALDLIFANPTGDPANLGVTIVLEHVVTTA